MSFWCDVHRLDFQRPGTSSQPGAIMVEYSRRQQRDYPDPRCRLAETEPVDDVLFRDPVVPEQFVQDLSVIYRTDPYVSSVSALSSREMTESAM